MIALVLSVLVASLVGSVHCAGMCGGIAACASGIGECGVRLSAWASAWYHLARGLSYAVVGAVAGAVGQAVDGGGGLIGVQRGAAVIAGLSVALVGTSLIARAGGTPAAATGAPQWLARAIAAVHRRAVRLPPERRAAALGLASALLPCGWLWAFAAVAAGTGLWWAGALVMAAFWLGTVPLLAALSAGVASLGLVRRRWITALAGMAMIAVGVHTTVSRAPLASAALEAATQGRVTLAGQSIDPRDAHAIPVGTPSCCRPPAAGPRGGVHVGPEVPRQVEQAEGRR